MKRIDIFLFFSRCLLVFSLALSGLVAAGLTASASAGLIRDTELERGLESLAMPLAREAGLRSLRIRIVPNESYNAFVMGGNTVYVHTGLLMKAHSLDEILGVFAHEIGHLAAGHAPRRSEAIRDANLTTTLATLAAAAVAASGASGDAALGVALGGFDRAERNYFSLSRQDEAVADEWALRLLLSQEISAAGMSSFMRRVAGERALPESRQSDYYRTHPAAGQRLLVFEDHVRAHGKDSPGISQDDELLIARLIAKIRAFHDVPMRTIGEVRRASKTTEDSKRREDWPVYSAEDNLYRLAIAHYRRGALNKAEAAMQELQAARPDNLYFHEFAGDILLSSGKIDDAISAYETALIAGSAPLIEFGLGRAYLAKADQSDAAYYQKAVDAFMRAVKIEGRWPELYRQLAISLGRDGQLAKADLALANEALLLRDHNRAKSMAKRALSHDEISKETRNFANDILFSLE